MPTIKINDITGLNLITAASGPGSGFSKYFSGKNAAFIASAELAQAMSKPITAFTAGPIGAGMNFAEAGTFGDSGLKWKFAAGASVTVHVTQPGKKLPGDDVFAHPITASAGSAIVSLSFTPSLSIGLSESFGELQFGFSAGGSIAFRTGRAFPATGNIPSLAGSLASLMAAGAIPANALDLASMQEGDIASLAGEGSLRFSAKFDVAQTFNPTASVNLPLKQLGQIRLETGASLTIGAGLSFQGAYQARFQKLAGNIVRLGYYRSSQTTAQLTVDVSISASVTAGKRELLTSIMDLLGSPKPDTKELVDAGLSDAQIDRLKDAVKASLDRSIAVSLSGAFTSSTQNSRMFEFEFDLDILGADGIDALNAAIRGDLTAITGDSLPHGVRMLASGIEEIRKKKVVWKLNFLGIFNTLSITELILKGNVLFNAETGELTVTDSVTARKVRVEARPLEADTKKLHKMLMQSLVFTAAYRASGTQALNAKFGASMSYFEQDANSNLQKISDYLDNFTALALATDAERTAFLAHPFRGRASVFIDAAFDDPAFLAMFLDAAGSPRKADEYETIGRQAIAALIRPGDPNSFRRLPMLAGDPSSDDLWKRMSSSGQPGFPFVLPDPVNSGPALGILTHDYTVVKWLAGSMAKTAVAVAAMKTFIDGPAAGKSPRQLETDPEFIKRRDKLQDALEDVATDALPDFLDAWGVIVMDKASQSKATLTATLLTTGPVLVKSRP